MKKKTRNIITWAWKSFWQFVWSKLDLNTKKCKWFCLVWFGFSIEHLSFPYYCILHAIGMHIKIVRQRKITELSIYVRCWFQRMLWICCDFNWYAPKNKFNQKKILTYFRCLRLFPFFEEKEKPFEKITKFLLMAICLSTFKTVIFYVDFFWSIWRLFKIVSPTPSHST